MTIARDEHTNNVVLGSGELYIDLLDSDDELTGERFLGDGVGATLSITTERTTIQSGTGQVAQDLVDVVRSVSRSIGFTVRDMSIDNWRVFLIGDDAADADRSVAVAAAQVVDEGWGDMKAGMSIQLGSKSSNPSGVGAVGKTITMKSNTTATPAANKWKLDATAGRIYFLADVADVKVTYSPVSKTVNRAIAGTAPKQIVCAVRYIEDTGSGDGRNVYARKCVLVPNGEIALMSRDTEQQMAFTASIQPAPTGWPSVVIDNLALSAS